MRAPRFRNYATPLGFLMLSGIIGARIAHRLRGAWGDMALYVGLAVLIAGMFAAVYFWQRGQRHED